MSEPVSALKNASDASGLVSVREIGPHGMITLRGDLGDKALLKSVAAVAGVTVPAQGHCGMEGDQGVAWMSPDELLLLCPYEQAHERLSVLSQKLVKQHALAVNVSDARALFEVGGAATREVIAKLAPVDMDPAAFTPGMFRRTRFAQVPAAFWLVADDTARVICFRSVAQYMFDVLRVAAQDGSEVGMF